MLRNFATVTSYEHVFFLDAYVARVCDECDQRASVLTLKVRSCLHMNFRLKIQPHVSVWWQCKRL